MCMCLDSTTTINCNAGSDVHLGAVDEGYAGDIEVVNGITAGDNVKLVPHLFPDHLEFLELSFTLGETSATVRTKKPLDADTESLAEVGSTLYYSVMCDGHAKYNNTRKLKINDLNDHSPVFDPKSYTTTVSEAHDVDTEVLRVEATDGDSSPENKKLTYSIAPASQDFMVTNSGAFILKRTLC
ncbi:protocadherin beta-18-like isoform X2 [Trachinotus anak]|uniref:protocadherin beta-18-like isoform X2 n=1 Tax=Trachinotus anak TaxID=443729 RepID=UPI0039F22051